MATPEPDDANTDSDSEPSGSESDAAPRSRLRGITALILVAVLGFMLAVQIRSHNTGSNLSTARTEDLVRILSDLDAQRERLSQDIEELQDDRDELTSGSRSHDAALRRAKELADSVEILSGTAQARGPGLRLTFAPGDEPVSAAVMLDAVEELRGAGAEAMQIDGDNDESVRIVAASYFSDDKDNLVVDETKLAAPYVLTVIGDPDTMSTAIDIPGGVADTVKKDGGTVKVAKPDKVEVKTLADVSPPEYAEPVD